MLSLLSCAYALVRGLNVSGAETTLPSPDVISWNAIREHNAILMDEKFALQLELERAHRLIASYKQKYGAPEDDVLAQDLVQTLFSRLPEEQNAAANQRSDSDISRRLLGSAAGSALSTIPECAIRTFDYVTALLRYASEFIGPHAIELQHELCAALHPLHEQATSPTGPGDNTPSRPMQLRERRLVRRPQVLPSRRLRRLFRAAVLVGRAGEGRRRPGHRD